MAQVTFNTMVDAPAGPPPANASHRDDRASDNLLVGAALGLCALRLAVSAHTGLVDDEAYYRLWSLAPALSYYDHPPMVAWMIVAGRAIAGDTALGIRLLAPIAHLIGTVLLWRTAMLLYGPETARRAAWFMLAMPLIAVGGVVVTPDVPLVIFSGAALWAIAELDRSRNPNWWLAVGAFSGLGLLSKYTALFLGATILIWLLAVPENRKWFRSPQLYVGGLIAIALASPVVIWNAEHDWVSFSKQFGRVAHRGGAGAIYLLEFAGGIFALASPVIAVLAIGGLVRVARSAVVDRRSGDVLLAAAVLPMVIYFLIHALHDRVQGNWPGPIYPPLAICAALGLERGVPARWRGVTFTSSLAVGFLMTAGIYIDALSPVIAFRKDPSEQMRGWPGFADGLERTRRETGAAWVATSSYATTGQLALALKGRSEVAQLDQRIRYVFLPPLPPALVAKPALYVELERRVDLPLLKAKFRKITPVGSQKRDNGSTEGATYKLFLLEEAPSPPL